MNDTNWLGFSLSHHTDVESTTTTAVDVAGDYYFDLAAASDESSAVQTSFPSPLGLVLDAFTRDNNSHSRDWDINGDACHIIHTNDQNGPKLENFLGRTTTIYNTNENVVDRSDVCGGGDGGGGGSLGLSMIKTWLRDQPMTNVDHQDNSNGSRGLSLSMNSSTNKNYNKNNVIFQEKTGVEATPKKTIESFGQRTSIYRGVTRHRWTGRYEAHLWDNSCKREGQTRKGRQVYLGGYEKEDKAARAYDLAALKYWGTTTTTNFPMSEYEKEVEEMKNMTRQEYVASLRRKSSGFSRGASIYRGVTRHHQHGRWQARIGRVAGNKDLYLGTFGTQEEAAEAYDIAAIKFRGLSAVTNFEMNRYNVKAILDSPSLPIGSSSKRHKPVPTLMVSSNVLDSGNNSSDWQSVVSSHHHQERYGGYYNGGNLSSESTRFCFKQEEDQQRFLRSSPSLMNNIIDHHHGSSTPEDLVTVCGNVVDYQGFAFTDAEIAYNARNHYYYAEHQQQIDQQSQEGDFPVGISSNVGSNM